MNNNSGPNGKLSRQKLIKGLLKDFLSEEFHGKRSLDPSSTEEGFYAADQNKIRRVGVSPRPCLDEDLCREVIEIIHKHSRHRKISDSEADVIRRYFYHLHPVFHKYLSEEEQQKPSGIRKKKIMMQLALQILTAREYLEDLDVQGALERVFEEVL